MSWANAILMLDPQGNITSWDVRAERLTSYRAEEIIGRHFSFLYRHETLQSDWARDGLNEARVKGIFFDEVWGVRKDGTEFPAGITITPLKDETGNLNGFSNITQDLTDRKQAAGQLEKVYAEMARRVQERRVEAQPFHAPCLTCSLFNSLAETTESLQLEVVEQMRAEDNLRVLRRRLDAILEGVGDAVLTLDNQGRISSLNPAAESLTGWTSANASGKPLEKVFAFFDANSHQQVQNFIDKVLQEGKGRDLVNHTLLVTRDGKEIPIASQAVPVEDGQGTKVGSVLTIRDLSERQRALEDRLHLAAILESAEDAIISKNLEGIILSWNKGAEHLYGYSAKEVIGKPLSILIPPDRPQELGEILKLIHEGERIASFETVRLGKGNKPLHVSLSVSPIKDAAGNIMGASVIHHDITERKRTERCRNVRLAVNQVLAESNPVLEVLPLILGAICEGLGWEVGVFFALDRQANVLQCREIWSRSPELMNQFTEMARRQVFGPGVCLPGKVWNCGKPVWVPDIGQDASLPCGTLAYSWGLHGAFGCPVRLGKKFLGVIQFFSHEVEEPDDDLLEIMAALGGQIGQFIHRKQAEKQVTAEHAVGKILAASHTIEEAAGQLLPLICENLGWDVGELWVRDQQAEVLRCEGFWNTPLLDVAAFEQDTRSRTYAKGEGFPGHVWASEDTICVFDVKNNQKVFPRAATALAVGLQGAISIPLGRGNNFFGVMGFFSRDVEQPDDSLMGMLTSIANQISQFIERRRTENELQRELQERQIARKIQQGLLPKTMPTLPGFRISGRSLTAHTVNGDCYDFLPFTVQGRECLGLLVGEASGHGIDSALLMAQTRAYLRALAMTYTGFQTLLTLTNRHLADDFLTDHYVSLFLGQLDPSHRTLEYVNAGHCLGYVIDPQGKIRIDLSTSKVPLGIDPANKFQVSSISLAKGDLVLLTTDGIIRATSPDQCLFGLKRMLGILREHIQQTPDEILDALLGAVNDFTGSQLQDDITAVLLKVDGIS